MRPIRTVLLVLGLIACSSSDTTSPESSPVSSSEEAKEAVQGQLDLPKGYSLLWSGQYENMARVRERLKFVLPLTIFHRPPRSRTSSSELT